LAAREFLNNLSSASFKRRVIRHGPFDP
jgi:hypothetical protein